MTGVTPAIGGAGTLDIQPAAGMGYCVTEIVSDQAQVGGVPDISAALRDAVLTDPIIILDPTTEVQKAGRAKKIYISNANYLRITNTAAGAAVIGQIGFQVRADIIRTDIFTAPNGGTVDVQAPAGEVWLVTEIGAETMNATNELDATVSLIDGVTNTAIMRDGARDIGWDSCNWYISNTIYLRLAPIGAADNDIGLCMIRVDEDQYAGIFTLGAGANADIQPAEGFECSVTGFGASVWAGVAAAGNMDVTVRLTDGLTPANVIEAGSVSDSGICNRDYELLIDNTNYLNVLDTGGAGVAVAYCGHVRRRDNTS
jgi:hypothetical protein